MKKISIIIPAYNAKKFIDECLKSCLNQDYSNKEIVVVDDGSTDGTDKIIEDRYLPEIKYIWQENSGGSAARNRGIEESTGEYIYFLDADDVLLPGSLRRLVKALEENSCDMSIGNFVKIDEGGGYLGEEKMFDKSKILKRDTILGLLAISPNPSTKLFKRDIINEYKIRFKRLRMAQDLDFYFKYLICCNSAVAIADSVYRYRIVGGSVSRTYDERLLTIVDAFKDVRDFAEKNCLFDRSASDLANVELLHIYYQLRRTKYIEDRKIRKKVFKGLKARAKRIKVQKKAQTYTAIRHTIIKLRIYCFCNLGMLIGKFL